MTNNFHALVVDDQQGDQVKELLESSSEFGDDSVKVTVISSFDQAIEELDTRNFDFIILDLKDDSQRLPDEESLRGKTVFNRIRETRFAPVIFYTGYPNRVDVEETDFLKVIERSDIEGLQAAVRDIVATKLIHLARHIEEQKRLFMWEFVEKHWNEIEDDGFKGEIAHMLSRRLADSLKKSAVVFFSDSIANEHAVRPIEMYIVPPSNFPESQAGDLIRDAKGEFFLVLTPTCDLVPKNGRCNAEFVLRAKCLDVYGEAEFIKIREGFQNGVQEMSKSARESLAKLVGNNRKGQPARYYFLPSVLNQIPDLVVDLQQLSTIAKSEVEKLERVASLDSPYAELIVQRLSGFLGRIGTPDLDREFVADKLVELARKEAAN